MFEHAPHSGHLFNCAFPTSNPKHVALFTCRTKAVATLLSTVLPYLKLENQAVLQQ